MKNSLIIISGLILCCTITSCGGRNINIPDPNFKAYLVGNDDINTNGDDEIQASEASSFTGGIYCGEINISDLTGIEEFTALTHLNCASTGLTSLDVSKNTALTILECGQLERNNQLTSLDVSKNTALTELWCGGNQLTTLDVSKNTALISLWCEDNKLTSLDVSKNKALNSLWCGNNALTFLDVSKNTSLTFLRCGGNQFNCVNIGED